MPTALRHEAGVRLRVELSEEIVAQYQQQADIAGVDLEAMLSDRLASCVSHTAVKPYYINDTDRQELEKILGKNMRTAKDLVLQVRNAVSVKLDNVKITIKPGLLSRLKTRCLGMKWEDFLEKIIIQDLERYAGMR